MQEEHLCADCAVDISQRRRDAQRCESCSIVRGRQQAKANYRKNRERVLQRAKIRQQTPEYKQSRQGWEEKNPERLLVYRQRQKEKHREKTDWNPEGRTCEDCQADISDRAHRARRCESCSNPPVRTCTVCSVDIRNRGASKFCSRECKIQDRLANDLVGSSKLCPKCKETKEYTAFRLHYGSRDSTCKSCEAKAAREYHRTVPVEERQRRRRIQGERERQKRASLSPEERTTLRTKVRRAHRRKLYGPDFDEVRLYSEQERKCAICLTHKPLEELEIDHIDREDGTRKLRGFLCKNCNFKFLSRYEKGFPPHRQDSPHLNAYLSRGKEQ